MLLVKMGLPKGTVSPLGLRRATTQRCTMNSRTSCGFVLAELPWSGMSLTMWWLDRWMLLGSRVLVAGDGSPESSPADVAALLDMESKLLVPYGVKYDLAVAGLDYALRCAVDDVSVCAPGCVPCRRAHALTQCAFLVVLSSEI